MIDFKSYLYEGIGERIKKVRETRGFSRQKFVSEFLSSLDEDTSDRQPLDISSLSNIESIKIHKKRNPYLLSKNQYELLPKFLGCSLKELFFGDENDRENTVQLILLTIILNGAKTNKGDFLNPFINTKLSGINYERDETGISSKEYDKLNCVEMIRISRYFNEFIQYYGFTDIDKVEEETKQWLEENYPFYSNTKNYARIKYLLSERITELEIHSNLLIKLLIGNKDFAILFMEGIGIININVQFAPNLVKMKQEHNIIDFIENVGQYGDLALDYKKSGYPTFIKAFDEMWQRHSATFMRYFEQKLFNIDLHNSGFKKINNEIFREIITSVNLTNDLYSMLEIDKYDLETMRGHNIFNISLQEIIVREHLGEKFKEAVDETNKEVPDREDILQGALFEGNLYKYITNLKEAAIKY